MTGHDCGFRASRYRRRDFIVSTSVATIALAMPSVAYAESTQTKWASCEKCRTIFYDGYRQKGWCAAGGQHVASANRLKLSYDVPESPTRQGDWRFCNRCSALFYDGYPERGVCPAGGGHVAQGYIFVLEHYRNAGGRYRYCTKCHAMFEQGTGGSCPATGNHAAAGYLFNLRPEVEYTF